MHGCLDAHYLELSAHWDGDPPTFTTLTLVLYTISYRNRMSTFTTPLSTPKSNPTQLKLISWNVAGLNTSIKRKKILTHLKKIKSQIGFYKRHTGRKVLRKAWRHPSISGLPPHPVSSLKGEISNSEIPFQYLATGTFLQGDRIGTLMAKIHKQRKNNYSILKIIDPSTHEDIVDPHGIQQAYMAYFTDFY